MTYKHAGSWSIIIVQIDVENVFVYFLYATVIWSALLCTQRNPVNVSLGLPGYANYNSLLANTLVQTLAKLAD